MWQMNYRPIIVIKYALYLDVCIPVDMANGLVPGW